jgi:hypothetical protein
MRVLITIAYLVLTVITIVLGSKHTRSQMQLLSGSKKKIPAMFFMSAFIFLIYYFQFWLLTGIFPVLFVVVIFLLSFLSRGIYDLVGAIGGFTIKEKKEKIQYLSFIYGAKNYRNAARFGLVLTVLYIISIVGSIWMFWKYPAGSPDRKVWVALYHFTILQLGVIVYEISLIGPIITSEFIDDDLRNSYLASKFAAIITSTLTILFPFWIFKEDLSTVLQKFNSRLPEFWILLSIPFILFIVTAVFPFFVGMYKYRSQTKAMLDWRADWLNNILGDLKLPKGDLQQLNINEKISALESRIKGEIDDNDLLKFFKEEVNTGFRPKKTKWQERIEQLQQQAKLLKEQERKTAITDIEFEENTPATTRTTVTDTALIKTSELDTILGPAQGEADSYLDDTTAEAIDYIKSKNKNLVKWDLRIQNIYRLMNIYKVVKSSQATEVKDYLENEAKEVENNRREFKASKNILAGAFLTVFSSVIIWVFKIFENDIIAVIRQLVK